DRSGGTAPGRAVEAPRALRREPRIDTTVGHLALPALYRPIRPVRRLARDDGEGKRRAVVRPARVLEVPPVGSIVILAPAAAVVPLEADLRHVGGRREGV